MTIHLFSESVYLLIKSNLRIAAVLWRGIGLLVEPHISGRNMAMRQEMFRIFTIFSPGPVGAIDSEGRPHPTRSLIIIIGHSGRSRLIWRHERVAAGTQGLAVDSDDRGGLGNLKSAES